MVSWAVPSQWSSAKRHGAFRGGECGRYVSEGRSRNPMLSVVLVWMVKKGRERDARVKSQWLLACDRRMQS